MFFPTPKFFKKPYGYTKRLSTNYTNYTKGFFAGEKQKNSCNSMTFIGVTLIPHESGDLSLIFHGY